MPNQFSNLLLKTNFFAGPGGLIFASENSRFPVGDGQNYRVGREERRLQLVEGALWLAAGWGDGH